MRILFLLFFLTYSLPAFADDDTGYYNAAEEAEAEAPEEEQSGAQTHVVTSNEKCYAALGRKETLDIQRNYIKPYQECRRRLALKLKEKAEGKDKDAEESAGAPEKPRNFHRVQQETAEPEKANESAKPAPESKP